MAKVDARRKRLAPWLCSQLRQDSFDLPSRFAQAAGAVAYEPQLAVALDERDQLSGEGFADSGVELRHRLVEAERQAGLADKARRFEQIAGPLKLG